MTGRAGMMAIVTTVMGRLRRRPATTDWIVGALVALVTANGTSAKVVSWLPHWVLAVLALTQGATILARRRAPLTVLLGAAVLGTFMIAVGYPAGSAGAGLFAAAYAVAVHLPNTVRGAAAAAAGAASLTAAMTTPDSRTHNDGSLNLLAIALAVAVAWISGYAIRTRRAYIAELKERAARLEAEEGQRAARAVADERLRIARELHDVIGHSISLITVQSEAAVRTARTNPGAVTGFLTTISATSREALTEMRHVLAVLRPDAATDLAPQPGLAGLPDLIARIESGGPKVRLARTCWNCHRASPSPSTASSRSP